MLDIHSVGFCRPGPRGNCCGFACHAINRETLEHIWAGHTHHRLWLECSCWCSHRTRGNRVEGTSALLSRTMSVPVNPFTIQVSCGTHCILIPQWSTWTQHRWGDALPLLMRKGGYRTSPLQSPRKRYHSCRPWRQTAKGMWSLMPHMVVSLWGCLLHFPIFRHHLLAGKHPNEAHCPCDIRLKYFFAPIVSEMPSDLWIL